MKTLSTEQLENPAVVQNANKETVDSPQTVKRTSSQGQLLIPEKGGLLLNACTCDLISFDLFPAVVEKVEEEQQNT